MEFFLFLRFLKFFSFFYYFRWASLCSLDWAWTCKLPFLPSFQSKDVHFYGGFVCINYLSTIYFLRLETILESSIDSKFFKNSSGAQSKRRKWDYTSKWCQDHDWEMNTDSWPELLEAHGLWRAGESPWDQTRPSVCGWYLYSVVCLMRPWQWDQGLSLVHDLAFWTLFPIMGCLAQLWCMRDGFGLAST